MSISFPLPSRENTGINGNGDSTSHVKAIGFGTYFQLVESIYLSLSINIPVISTFPIPMRLANSPLRKQLSQPMHWKTNPMARCT